MRAENCRLSCRGTDGSKPSPSSGESCKPSVPGERASREPPYQLTLAGARAARDDRDASEIRGFLAAVLQVRIHLPPAESQVQTCLSREFAFLGREAAVFRGCPGRDERPGSAETRGRGNIWPKGGDISVGPYSSTAPSDEVGDDAADLIADARAAVMSASSRCRAGRSVVAPENPPLS